MIRISTIFIAICMVLIAASLGLVMYVTLGFNSTESAIVALTVLTFMILYNAVSTRLRDRTDVSGQVANLSHGIADLARQVAEFGRRLAAVEARATTLDSTSQERVQTALGEINELGALVKQLAVSIAAHDDLLTGRAPPVVVAANDRPVPTRAPTRRGSGTPASDLEWVDAPVTNERAVAERASVAPQRMQQHPALVAAVKTAIDSNRIDIYLQPLVTLPQRKVRFYEAMSRIRDDQDQLIAADDFIAAAEASGLMAHIDRMVLLRCIQVLRRLMVRNKDVGVFCNLSAATLANREVFAQCLDFLDANRVLAPSFVLEFKQATLRSLTPLQSENLAALAQRGFRFSIDHVADLRLEPRELADRGVRFIKVPAHLLLDQKQLSSNDIHPADLSDLLGRFGIALVAERIEGERAVVDLLDYDVRFGQGFLFAPPRPLRPEGTPPTGGEPVRADTPRPDAPRIEPADGGRVTGKAALARRVGGPN
jgi:cyclic-di-GMP phosphodiesterase, flagellum assembly factor TipF